MIVLSLGAGVQSTVMALMSAHGELPRPNCAIFADTKWEPEGVYRHLDWLESIISNPLLVKQSFPIYRVVGGDIRDDVINNRPLRGRDNPNAFSSVPFFTDGKGFGRRQCTNDYKIRPVRKKIRELLGVGYGERVPKGTKVTQWLGISIDEASRMKPAQEAWLINTWPLIEANMSRQKCIQWFEKHYPDKTLTKSACIGCPLHNDAMWRDIKLNDAKSWEDAVAVDKLIRDGGRNGAKQYMHSSLKPLDEIDFRNLEDKGQLNMFENECEGMCGV